MEFKDNLFENIVVIGQSSETSSVLDAIEAEEEKIGNKDLYDAMLAINKVLEAPSRYNEIQSVSPAINVNSGIIKIDGVCKHNVKANAFDLDTIAGELIDNQYSSNIIDTFVADLIKAIPDNLKVKYEILEDEIDGMNKKRFEILITRKG